MFPATRSIAIAALCVGAVFGVAGCTTPSGSSTSPTDAPGSVATGDTGDGATGTMAPPLANPAPTSIPKATRSGETGAATEAAPTAGFAAPAEYPDGVKVAVTKAAKAVESGTGPGQFNGRELIVVDLQVTNGSSAAIDLNQVVITTTYGQSRQIAPAVYPGNITVNDFSGSVAAGATATARYAFAVPAADLGLVSMTVDFDASHASAIFTGAVSAQ